MWQFFKKFYGKIRSYNKKIIHTGMAAFYGFIHDECYLKASALTFYTLLSIVPLLAIIFGIAKGFGFEKYLETQLMSSFQQQGDVLGYAIQIAHSMLLHSEESLIVGVGIIFLFWTNLTLLGNIEQALNDIWKIKKPRSFMRKITDYLATTIICPIAFVVSSSITVFLKTQIHQQLGQNQILEMMGPYLLFFFRILPLFFSWMSFAFIYIFMPNAKIRIWPRILAGVIGGTAFQVWQLIYIRFQMEVFNYSVVYGTFAALPLFLVWLQISWLIVLAGAEIAASIENDIFIEKSPSEKFVDASQKHIALLILLRCIRAFYSGEPPLTALHIAKELKIHLQDAQHIIDMLEQENVLGKMSIQGHDVPGFLPARDARLYTVKGICDVIDKCSESLISVKETEELRWVTNYLQQLNEIMEHSDANIQLSKLVSEHKLFTYASEHRNPDIDD